MTNKERQRRGFTTEPMCNRCLEEEEDLDLVFRNCCRSLPLWEFFMDRMIMNGLRTPKELLELVHR